MEQSDTSLTEGSDNGRSIVHKRVAKGNPPPDRRLPCA